MSKINKNIVLTQNCFKAYLGLGANIGNREKNLSFVIEFLVKHVQINSLVQSKIYNSAPVEAIGPDFLNQVVKIETSLSAFALHEVCKNIESKFAPRVYGRNAPRSIDMDILLYNNEIIISDLLTIPHPRMTKRAFVLLPLWQLDPNLNLPGLGPITQFLPAVKNQIIGLYDCSANKRKVN